MLELALVALGLAVAYSTGALDRVLAHEAAPAKPVVTNTAPPAPGVHAAPSNASAFGARSELGSTFKPGEIFTGQNISAGVTIAKSIGSELGSLFADTPTPAVPDDYAQAEDDFAYMEGYDNAAAYEAAVTEPEVSYDEDGFIE